MSQNIFDNKKFFKNYKALRETDNNFNDLFEQPAMRGLLPDLTNKTVLDIGCGFGKNCVDFSKLGAKNVVGIDISKKMLDIAQTENKLDNIVYYNLDMADLQAVNHKFDFVYSSLAFHYAEDFEKLMIDIFDLLNPGGELLFSQEHPIVTASNCDNAGYYILDKHKNPIAYALSNYGRCGKRSGKWFVDGVENYHRRFSDIINALCKARFIILEVCEPLPSDYALEKRSGLAKEFIKPSFIIVKAVKPD